MVNMKRPHKRSIRKGEDAHRPQEVDALIYFQTSIFLLITFLFMLRRESDEDKYVHQARADWCTSLLWNYSHFKFADELLFLKIISKSFCNQISE